MLSYKELVKKHREEFTQSNFLKYAFGQSQFDEMVRSWGLDPEKKRDLDKISSVGSGGYILKQDIPAFKELLRSQANEMKQAIDEDKTGDGFIRQMFLHAMSAVEFSYTMDEDEVLDYAGISRERLEGSIALQNGFIKAKKSVLGSDVFG